jgi:type IVB pilus formation R64 PilN family outer membrane protein
MTNFLRTGISAACAVFLVGCAYNPAAIEATVAANQVSAQSALSQKLVPPPSLVASDRPWIPLKKLGPRQAELATAQTDVVRIGFNKRFSDLNDVSAGITSATGISVVIAQDVFGLMGAGSSSGAGTGASTRTSLAITPASALSINYSGNLTGLANYVASAYGISWQMDGRRIRFFRNESRTFRVVALPGDTHLSAQVGSSISSGGGGAGGSGGSAAVQAQSGNRSTGAAFSGLSVWKGLESAVKQMLSTSGSVIASPSTGTITITDTPDVVASVAAFLREQNESLSRLVSVNVRVLSVQLKDGASRGINWDAVYDKVNASNTLSLRTSFPGAGTLILSNRSDGPLNGTKAMIDALATQGRVSEVTSTQLVTMNNQPVPINVGTSRAYVASTSITQTANVGSTSTITPGSVQTGFAMSLVPHIIDQQNVIMQYSMDISSLVDLESFTSGGATVQLPNVASNNFIQRVKLRSGETLVVAGFDQKDQSTSGQGLGNSQNALAGAQSTKNNQTLMVVLIQPTIAN